MTDSLYRISIHLADGSITAFDNQPADVVDNVTHRFLHRLEDGLTFATLDGFRSWRWDEIRGVGAIRMVALTGVELLPRLVWTPTAVPEGA